MTMIWAQQWKNHLRPLHNDIYAFSEQYINLLVRLRS